MARLTIVLRIGNLFSVDDTLLLAKLFAIKRFAEVAGAIGTKFCGNRSNEENRQCD